MIRGIAITRSGMAWEQARSEVIADNVANVNTVGYKRSMALGAEFGAMMVRRLQDSGGLKGVLAPGVGRIGQGATLREVAQDVAAGAPELTGQPLDVALQGPGEFVFQGPAGPGYTRNGNFHRAVDGTLVTADGRPVLVNGAPVGQGAQNLTIETGGVVMLDGRPAGRLDLRGAAGQTSVTPGALERSNVDLAGELTDLITALRSFQANQRALQAQDETLAKAASDIGRV